MNRIYIHDSGTQRIRVMQERQPDHFLPLLGTEHFSLATSILLDVLGQERAEFIRLIVKKFNSYLNRVIGSEKMCGTWAITDETVANVIAEILANAQDGDRKILGDSASGPKFMAMPLKFDPSMPEGQIDVIDKNGRSTLFRNVGVPKDAEELAQ